MEINYPNDDSAGADSAEAPSTLNSPGRRSVPKSPPPKRRATRAEARALLNIEPKLDESEIAMRPSFPLGAGRSLHRATTCLPHRPKPTFPTCAPAWPKPFERSSIDWVKLESDAEAPNLHVTAAPGFRTPKHPIPHAAYRRDRPPPEGHCQSLPSEEGTSNARLPLPPKRLGLTRAAGAFRPPKQPFRACRTLGPPKRPSRRNTSSRGRSSEAR